MIAVSSFRPFRESPAIALNQAHAFASWLPVFDCIYYFGAPEPRLRSTKTVFVSSPPFPTIRLLAQMCAIASEPACIINADIVLSPKAHAILKGAMSKVVAATSFRFEFDPAKANFATARRIDYGLDLFIAHPHVWQSCWPHIPEEFRIGKPVWDSWLNAWLRDIYRLHFMDLTSHRIVFHPKHGFRRHNAVQA